MGPWNAEGMEPWSPNFSVLETWPSRTVNLSLWDPDDVKVKLLLQSSVHVDYYTLYHQVNIVKAVAKT